MIYDIGILICIVFVLLIAFVGLYVCYKIVFSLTDEWFEDDNAFLKAVFRIVLLPLSICLLFAFLSYPIMFIIGAAIQLSFHGS